MKHLIFGMFLMLISHYCSAAYAQPGDVLASPQKAYAVATWVEIDKDGYNIVEVSSYKLAGKDKIPVWDRANIIHNSSAPITSTSLVTLDNGEQFLFWAEQKKAKTQIKYKRRPNNLGDWVDIQTLHDKGSENIGVSVFRYENSIWAFWASTSTNSDQTALPDIVYRELQNGVWKELKPLHAPNAVPDIQPLATMNQDGELLVEWLSYSFLQASYISAKKVFSYNFDISSLVDIIDVDTFGRPDFLPSGQAITLRFPKNHFNQSRVVASAEQRNY